MKRHFRRRKALLKAIELAGCDVVALQGLVGGDITIAREGLQYFVKRLTKSTEVEWDGLVGASNAASYYNAFLLKKSIPLETFRSYAERSLLGFGEYKSPRFSRGPFELTLNVPGKEAAPTKKVLLYTMQLRRRAIGEKPEDEKHKMQMAETFRRIVERKTREFDDDEKPIVLFLGDRGGYRMAPTSQILEGQIELLDFRTKGACKVEWEISPKGLEEQKRREELEERLLAFAEENDKDFETLKEKNIPNEPLETRPKTKCEPVKKLKRYFGLLSENLPPKPKLLKRRVKGEVRLRLEEEDPKLVRERKLSNYERNSDIYLSQSDLTYALIDEGSPLRYAVGQLEVENDLENSPLIWVDLNW